MTIKLSKSQQEVLDLMKDGWELGCSMTLDGGCSLQKGGQGRGGETKTVHSNTVHALYEARLINISEVKFPTKTYVLTKERKQSVNKPQVQDPSKMNLVKTDVMGDTYKHPSFGSISFSQGQGRNITLFGSSVKHNSTISLRVNRAEYIQDGGHDHTFDRDTIVEVQMSHTQFANAITGMQSGSGIPVTIRYIKGEGNIPAPEFVNKRQQFDNEFIETTKGLMERLTNLEAQVRDKNAPKWIWKELEILRSWFKTNIPYLSEQFQEQMDKTVTEAKGEVEGYINNLVKQTGLESIRQQAPQLTTGKDVEDELTEEPKE